MGESSSSPLLSEGHKECVRLFVVVDVVDVVDVVVLVSSVIVYSDDRFGQDGL